MADETKSKSQDEIESLNNDEQLTPEDLENVPGGLAPLEKDDCTGCHGIYDP